MRATPQSPKLCLFALLSLTGCLPEEFTDLGGGTTNPEPWGPPIACTDTCPEGFTCLWERCQWEEMLTAVNAARASPRTCGEAGSFAAVPALEFAPPLTEAALLHSTTMAESGCFSHDATGTSPCDDGTPCTRIAGAGYYWSAIGENISAGQTSAAEAMAAWLASPGHCANIMSPVFVHFGAAVAFSADGNANFTQTFGTPGGGTANECQ